MTYGLANFEPSYLLYASAGLCFLVVVGVLYRLRSREGWRRTMSALSVVLVAVLGVVLAYFGHSANNVTLRVDEAGITIEAAFYGRTIPRASLRVSEAAIVAPQGPHAHLQAVRRTNGLGLPGLQLGWFTLADGRKALLAVSDWNEVLHVPTTEGYDLLLTPEEPIEFLSRLREPNAQPL